MSQPIHAVTVPKWGMAMDEGTVTGWHVAEGARVEAGQELLDLESTKIANAIEAKQPGVLRRAVAPVGAVLPVGGLLGVIAQADVPEEAIEAFVAGFVVEAPEEDGAGGPRTSMIDVGGSAIHYLDSGSGDPPVVLVHGFGGDLNGWMFVQPALAERRRTIALDLPGHGQSTKDIGAGTVEGLAATLADFLDALSVGSAHLVGHSLGGAVALALALAAPGRVASLSLIAPAGVGSEVDAGYLGGFLAANRRKEMTQVLGRLFADAALVSRAMVEDVLKAKRIDGAEAALRAIAEACFPADHPGIDLRARLGELRVPAQAIWGTRDTVIPTAQVLPSGIEITRLDAGHMPHMEKSAEVIRAIEALCG